MRSDNRFNIKQNKVNSRRKYSERQINKWIKWSWETRGKIIYKELIEIQTQYGIKCYG
jgi:hypothetical protein